MIGWDIRKAKDLLSFRTGKLDSNAAEKDGRYPFFTCAQETYRINKYAFDTECVLLAGNNAAGVFPLKYFNGKFNAYQRTYIIEPKNREQLDMRFLYNVFFPFLKQFEQSSTGVTTKFLTLGILNNILVPLPPLPIQREIAAILSAYDDLIENNNRRIAILEKMAEEIYKEWFGRMRFPGHEKVKLHKGVPEGWEKIKIGDAFQFIGGGTPSTEENRYWQGGNNNWYTPSDITARNGTFLSDSRAKCTEEGLRNSSAKLFPQYSIMMTSRATIGAIAINTTEACTNQGFITCLPNDRYPLIFLYHWLKLNKPNFELLSSGSTFNELIKSVFRKIEILTPPKEIVAKFERTAKPLFDKTEKTLKKNGMLKQSRNLLLSRLITGKLSVEDLDIKFPPSMRNSEPVEGREADG